MTHLKNVPHLYYINLDRCHDQVVAGFANMLPINRENEPRISVFDDSNSEFDETEKDNLQNDVPPWDVFECLPPPPESGSMRNNRFFEIVIWILKVLIYGLLFSIVLCSGIASKFAILLATAQLRKNQSMSACNHNLELEESFTEYTQNEINHIKWTWCLIFIFLVPECIGVLNTLLHHLFKRKPRMPKKRNILFMILMDTLHSIGLVLLTFVILPGIGVVQGAVIFCCLCFIPGLLNLLSRNKENWNVSASKLRLLRIFDALALIGQVGGMLWPLILSIKHDVDETLMWISPIALILCSCRWWSNFISLHSNIGLMRFLSHVKEDLQSSQHVIQGYVSLWRIFIFITGALVINVWKGIDVKSFFSPKFTTSTPLYIFGIQAICAMTMYQSCKFAYRTHMHQFGFAFPINLATPGAVCLIVTLCTFRNKDNCAFHKVTSDYLFFEEFLFGNWNQFLSGWYIWFWLIWLASQIWITMHLWTTENERLALAERIFSIITYDSLMIDQCLALNRRTQNENIDQDHEEKDEDTQLPNGNLKLEATDISLNVEIVEQNFDKDDLDVFNKRKDRVTSIYACATMWHEEKNEMNHLVGSILRLDQNQCAIRVTQEYYKIHIEDYYELETHIFFDDAFCCMHGCDGLCNHDENETQVNQYVITLVETVQRNVESLRMPYSPPTKYPTPYGGRLVWTLPGETKLVVHLKDKNKIRHRKRWSQVMYMYYLLGYRLMGLPIDADRKESIAENTYILTLDGDIDFRPAAVKVLVDLMKKDRDLGAACGRIHPVGSGPMVWFQKFEYAIGHWLQKSTEHTIGCVLCSPGCFSLFRAKALQQPNVMAKYATKSTEARHYIQYDQGEDRWLCTLLLQVGSRVEYSAASDAYTHAPELFKDFYIQRRRWIPSTIANIFDLLMTAKETRKVNNDISWLYIAYQWILMGSTILGPGTIFLMLVGAFVAAFHIDNWTSFWYNLIPIGVFVAVCFTCKERMQLIVAEIISAIYGLVMIVVLVGIMLQIAEDGWLAPSSLLFFIVACQMTIAGLLHPQEATCLLCGVIYYITVPSMYMLLIIFSVFNVHNVTWGTRDSKRPNVTPQDEQRSAAINDLSGFMIGKRNKQDKIEKGTMDFSLGNFFKCVCCIHSGISYEEKRLNEINESLQQINKRLNLLDRLHVVNMKTNNVAQSTSNTNVYPRSYFPIEETEEEEMHEGIELQHITDKSNQESAIYKDVDDDESDVSTQVSATSSQDQSSFLISPYWLQDERLRRGVVDFLSNEEEEFWKDLIGKYLRPIESDEESQNKITQELMNCRDAYLSKFFMLNALFVLIVFLMQLNKGTLHLQWPLGMKYNVTYDSKKFEVHLTKEYLRLEPIGCLFIAAFISILGIQFCAMLVHRFGTLSHVLANTKLPFCTKMTSSEDIFEKHADKIAEILQRMAEDDMIFEFRRSTVISPNKRYTHDLTENSRRSKILSNFEKLFRRKLRDPNSGLSQRMSSQMPKSAFNAFERRRSTILATKRRTQTKKSYDIYDDADNLRSLNGHTFQPGQSNQFQYDNPTFKRDESI
ncbi:chitin synthase chs-2 [Monomorium pharaonis]|uniref:chitin synthase chs-2 n=1 Tax=Monomorium pharaonis TaxID=307658 RepID=UPI00063F8420|nr:chitin synthase chs-2 [Monomorium pharaonis]